MSKVILSGFITIPEKDLTEVKAALPQHIALTRAESGCLKFEVTESPDDSTRFEVYEEFTDAEAFQIHQQRVRSSVWGDCTKNVKRNYDIKGLDE